VDLVGCEVAPSPWLGALSAAPDQRWPVGAGTLSSVRVGCRLSEPCLLPRRIAASGDRSLTYPRRASSVGPQLLGSLREKGGWHMRVIEMTESVVSRPRTGIC
jgi:hypothetical protein